MIYIVLALKSEAQAFVDALKLKKSKLSTFTFFYNDTFSILVSGVGVQHARLATQTLINHCDIYDTDIFLNIGVCAAQPTYAIGSLLEVASLEYKTQHFYLHTTGVTLTCLDEACSDANVYEAVDMESFGFYDAVVHNPAIQHFSIFKVVSDHFQPHTLTKDGVKSLLFQKIDAILEIISKGSR